MEKICYGITVIKPTNMRILSFCTLSFFFISCSQQPPQKKQIDVTGFASVKVVPDMVDISLRAENLRPAMKDAVAQTQADVNEILAVCRKYISNPSDIKVSMISTNKSYDYRNGRDVFIGFNAAQVLEVSLKNITQIEKFTEELLGTRISRIDNIRYNHTKSDSIMREVNLLALEDARKTAEKMSAKMQVGLGQITYLSNIENAPNRTQSHGNQYYEMNLYNKNFGGRGFKMTAEILEFGDAAYASFEIN